MSYQSIYDGVVNELSLTKVVISKSNATHLNKLGLSDVDIMNTQNLRSISVAIKNSVVGVDTSRYIIAIMVEYMKYPNMILKDKTIPVDEVLLDCILFRIKAAKTKRYMADILPLDQWEQQVRSLMSGPK